MNSDNTTFALTKTDMQAVNTHDHDHINNKGAKFYNDGDYKKAVEYYRLAATMGNVYATTNLAYCYLYGRSIEPNLSLAISYLKLAESKHSIDATYKLGDIFGSPKWGVEDKELSLYYYQKALGYLLEDGVANPRELAWRKDLQRYPSLCFALGREMGEGGGLNTDLESAYIFLKHAESGYTQDVMNGAKFYEKTLESVKNTLRAKCFARFAKLYDPMFETELDDDDDASDAPSLTLN